MFWGYLNYLNDYFNNYFSVAVVGKVDDKKVLYICLEDRHKSTLKNYNCNLDKINIYL